MQPLIRVNDTKKGYVAGGVLSKVLFKLLNLLAGSRKPTNRIIPDRCRRIIIVRLGGIGDAILATPILSHLQRRFPNANIDFVSWTQSLDVMKGNRYIHTCFSSKILDNRKLKCLFDGSTKRELSRIRFFFKGADLVIFLNRIDSVMGSLKLAMLAYSSHHAVRLGLDTDKRGFFLDVRVQDGGYFIKHEVAWAREVLDKMGIQSDLGELKIELNASKADNRYISTLLQGAHVKDYIVLHIGSSTEGWRNLKKVELSVWKTLIGKVRAQYDLSVILVGTRSEHEYNEVLINFHSPFHSGQVHNFAGLTSIPQLAVLISGASIFIGTDSGVAHIASSTKTPVITLFGFSDFIGFKPWSSESFVVRKNLACSPCIYRRGFMSCKDRQCLDIKADDIYLKVVEILGDN